MEPITFLCPRCKEKHPVSDIAFSLPDEVAGHISQRIASFNLDPSVVRLFNL